MYLKKKTSIIFFFKAFKKGLGRVQRSANIKVHRKCLNVCSSISKQNSEQMLRNSKKRGKSLFLSKNGERKGGIKRILSLHLLNKMETEPENYVTLKLHFDCNFLNSEGTFVR